MFTGGENAHPYDELATPAPRGHMRAGRPARRRGADADARPRRRSQAGARAALRHPRRAARRRRRRPGRRRARHAVRRDGVDLRARTGVVLTAGGFINNAEMIEQYAPAVHATALRLGTDGDDGRGIRMAQAVGARVKRMDAIECALPFNAPRSLVHGIIVNRYGQRFINEDTYMGRVGQTSLVHQGGQAYLIVDEEHYAPNWLGIRATWVCETAAELEAEIGLPTGSLVGDPRLLQRARASGRGSAVPQAFAGAHAAARPLAAFDLRADKFIYAPFTLGGLHTRRDGAVLDLDGEPIPGLYAAGRTTSGVAAQGYCSGLSLGDSTFFGRLAGLSAAGASGHDDPGPVPRRRSGGDRDRRRPGHRRGLRDRAGRGGCRRRDLGAHRGAAAARPRRRSRPSAARRTSWSPT